MSSIVIYSFIYLIGVILSSFAQLLLKKSALTSQKNIIKEYLNKRTLFAYLMFFSATIFSVLAFKEISLSLGPVLGTSEYIFITILSCFCLKEKISGKKVLGLLIVILGILFYFI